MNIEKLLMQKNGYVISSLAKEFLGYEVGDRISSVREIAERFSVGNGTVQIALQRLEDIKAIEFEKHGYKGTEIKSIDYLLLNSICGINGILGVMPLPYSKRFEGLATGLFNSLNSTGIKVNLAFMSGSKNRIEALLDGRYDFAVVSSLTSKKYVEKNPNIEVVKVLYNESFINYHVLVYRKGFDVDNESDLRVGVDLSSDDQVFMTMKYFEGKEIKIVPVRYSNISESITNDQIDVAIWSTDNIPNEEGGLEFRKIYIEDSEQDETQAAIIILKTNYGVKNYIQRHLNIDVLKKIQNDVIEGRQTAQY